MAVRYVERPGMSDIPASTTDHGAGFCPECGQSLQLTRHLGDVPRRRKAEPWFLALVGLYLVVVFGARSWQAHGTLVGVDRQVEGSRTAMMHDVFGSPSNQAMAQAENVNPLLMDRVSLQQRFARDLTGLVLGLIGLVAGVGALNRLPPGLAVRRLRRHVEIDGLPSSRNALGQITVSLGAMGNALARSLYRVLLIVFGGSVAGQLIRGVHPTLDVVDQALARTIEIVTTIGGMLG